jgi:hypothetical protein
MQDLALFLIESKPYEIPHELIESSLFGRFQKASQGIIMAFQWFYFETLLGGNQFPKNNLNIWSEAKRTEYRILFISCQFAMNCFVS